MLGNFIDRLKSEKLLVSYYTMWALVFFASTRVFPKVFFSNIVAGVMFFATALYLFLHKREAWTPFILLFGLCVIFFIDAYFFGLQENGVFEFLKVVLIFWGGVFLARSTHSEKIDKALSPFPLMLLLFLVVKLALHQYEIREDLRVGLYSSLGGPNTMGFIIGAALIYLLCTKQWSDTVKAIVSFLLLFFLLGTFSRTAILGVFGVFAYLFLFCKVDRKKYMAFGALVLIFAMGYYASFQKIMPLYGPTPLINPASLSYGYYESMLESKGYSHTEAVSMVRSLDPDTLSAKIRDYNIERFASFNHYILGSGRLTLWAGLVQRYADTPSAWFLGFGPSLVHHLRIIDEGSLDSILMVGLYSYGIVGLLAAVLFLFYLFVQRRSDPYFLLKRALSLYLIFTLIVTNPSFASQALLVSMLLIGFLKSRSCS